MGRPLVLALGADAPSTGRPADYFVAEADAGIAALRAQIEAIPVSSNNYMLAIGMGDRIAIDGADWTRDLLAPLRLAFGFVTGAARKLRRAGDRGSIVFLLPSSALLPGGSPSVRSVLLRALLGMAEALRAELGASPVRASIVFHAVGEDPSEFGARLDHAVAEGPMYSLSPDLDAARIRGYFAPLFDAIEAAGAGPPLPDIGPMAMVYDLDRTAAAAVERPVLCQPT